MWLITVDKEDKRREYEKVAWNEAPHPPPKKKKDQNKREILKLEIRQQETFMKRWMLRNRASATAGPFILMQIKSDRIDRA